MAAVPSIGRATRVERSDAAGAAAAGDLYERYSGQIYGYCLHQLGSREEAEDAVQTTFMNAFRGLQRGIVPELESAWLFKIAHNVCLSRRRSSWRRGRVESPNNFEVLQEIVPGREHAADELIRLQDVLEQMPENQRRAILLREWQGLTYREISDELGLSQAAVETLIFRARRALAQGLEQDAVTWKKRLRRGADVGGVIACVKTLLGGGGAAAIKIGTTTAIVAATAVAAATAPIAPKHASAYRAHAAKSAKPVAAAVTPARTVSSSHNVSHTVRRVPVAAAPAQTPSAARVHAAAGTVHAPASATPSVGAPTIPVESPDQPAPAAAPPAAQVESAPPAPAPPTPDSQSTPPIPPADPGPPADQQPPSESHGNKPDKQKPDNGHGNGK
ncbi:MAG: sigma-70 family RNA polymerase sigma factor [Gaiellaceae bacterium]